MTDAAILLKKRSNGDNNKATSQSPENVSNNTSFKLNHQTSPRRSCRWLLGAVAGILLLLLLLLFLLLLSPNKDSALQIPDIFNKNPEDGISQEEGEELVVVVAAPAEVAEQRIIALGDLHGDKPMAVKAMRLAGIIDGNENWAAGSSVFVQTVCILRECISSLII